MSLSRRSFLQAALASLAAVPILASSSESLVFDGFPQGVERIDRDEGHSLAFTAMCSNHKLRHMIYNYSRNKGEKLKLNQYYRRFRWHMNTNNPKHAEQWRQQISKWGCLADPEAQLRLMWEMDKKFRTGSDWC